MLPGVYAISAKMRLGSRAVCRRPSGGRRSVAEGDSAKRILYSAAKRPNSQNPNCVAIAVTVAAAGPASPEPAVPDAFAAAAGTASGPSRYVPGSIGAVSAATPRSFDRFAGDTQRRRDMPQHAAKPAHDELVLSLCRSVLGTSAAETGDHGFDQCLLEPARSVGIGDDFGDLSADSRRRMQPLEPCHRGW